MMDPRAFLNIAGEAAAGTREEDWRTAAGRAYYAAFLVARDLLVKAGFQVPPDQGGHAYIWLRLSNCGRTEIEEAGKTLRNLRRHRTWADYDTAHPFPEELAVQQVNQALTFVDVLDALAETASALATVVANIRDNEQRVLGENTYTPP